MRATANALRVQITDIVVGDGDAADTGKGVTLKWVLRRSNGYYVSSSTEGGGEPFIYRVSEHHNECSAIGLQGIFRSLAAAVMRAHG